MIVRRVALAAILSIGIAVTVVSANPTVTIVLTNGQQYSGQLVYHHGDSVGVLSGSGQEQSWPFSDIAVIEFVPGQPPVSELAQLPKGERELMRHAIALRDGGVIAGKVNDFSDDGNTVLFDVGKEGPGNYQRQQYNASGIARVYINPQAAQSALNAAGSAQQTPVATTGQQAITVQVSANTPWTDTGITVRRRDHLAISATGQIQWGQASTQTATADGDYSVPVAIRAGYPVPQVGAGALVGRVGNGRAFAIGANNPDVVAPATGRLYLGVNDSELSDNSGSFTVTISRR